MDILLKFLNPMHLSQESLSYQGFDVALPSPLMSSFTSVQIVKCCQGVGLIENSELVTFYTYFAQV